MTYTIEKGIPIPPLENRGGNRCWENPNSVAATLRRMEVGDSVFIPGPSYPKGATLDVLRKKGIKFTRRRQEGGYRIWRIQ
jgi:hypothetical protein